MSLEKVIQENTLAIRDLIEAISRGASVTTQQVAAVVEEAAAVEEVKSDEQMTQPTAASAEKALSNIANAPATASYEDAKKWVLEVSSKNGRDRAVALLSQFGASKLPDVEPAKFADVIEAAKAELGVA